MSDFNQSTFSGGMNLLGDDTSLQPNQYRIGFNMRNRYGTLDLIKKGAEDPTAPVGLKQELITFGIYVLIFVAGAAYYRRYDQTGWITVVGFSMSKVAPRYWTKAVPISLTNYARLGVSSDPTDGSLPADARSGIVQVNNASALNAGNLPGLLVQDNINQPQFIFLDANGQPTARTTQSYDKWNITFADDGVTVTLDQREYVPIGNVMEFDGVTLYVASQDGSTIYRAVSGRPLDFVINVNTDGSKGGDAKTTAYSVGVGPISTLHLISGPALFVSAGGANFSVAKNTSPTAPTEFGEYTFTRTFLFNDICLSDRAIIDTIGDTRFIDYTGLRSFNAVEQQQNEGRNSPFSSIIAAAFGKVRQNALGACSIVFDNYELYSVQTIFGAGIAVFDTINACWTAFDTTQTNGQLIKTFAKIELDVQALFCITADDKLIQLYGGTDNATAIVRPLSVSANQLQNNINVKLNHPKSEIKPTEFRIIVDDITEDCSITVTPYVNNRKSSSGSATQNIEFVPSPNPSTDMTSLPDVDTQLENRLFTFPDCEQGWKAYCLFSWTDGSVTQFSMALTDNTPMQPPLAQATTAK